MRFADAAGTAAFTAGLRNAPPDELAGRAVVGRVDYRDGIGSLPATDLLQFDLADGSRALVRPSGTEPKVKCYFEVVVEQHHGPEAQKRLAALRTAFQEVAGTMPR